MCTCVPTCTFVQFANQKNCVGLVYSALSRAGASCGQSRHLLPIGPQDWGGASKTITSPIRQSMDRKILASLFIGYCWIVTHLQLNQLCCRFKAGPNLLNVSVLKQKDKQARKEAQLLMQLCELLCYIYIYIHQHTHTYLFAHKHRDNIIISVFSAKCICILAKHVEIVTNGV